MGGINALVTQGSHYLQQPRCPVFSHSLSIKETIASHNSSVNSNAGIRGKSFRLSIPTSMETDLMSVQSGSVNQFELDLLGTLTTAIDDENLVMTDNLIDRYLKFIILGQCKQLSTVSRVPYKRVSSSQTDKSRESRDLGNKDPSRSTPNSALSDSTWPAMPLHQR